MLHEGAFTLLEVMVVIAILAGLVAAVPWIAPRQMETWRTKATVREALTLLKEARIEAVLTHGTQHVQVDPHSKSLSWTNRPRSVVVPNHIVMDFFPSHASTNDSNEGAIRFYADGSAMGGTLVLLHQGTSYRIGVDWLTGHTTVEP